jgi:hypothetical protein
MRTSSALQKRELTVTVLHISHDRGRSGRDDSEEKNTSEEENKEFVHG